MVLIFFQRSVLIFKLKFIAQSEAEAVQSIVNPDGEPLTKDTAKRPEALGNDNW